jgi:hypothetical protein
MTPWRQWESRVAKLLTPYPDYHSRCRLGSTILPASQIVGLLDGDGSLTLNYHGRRAARVVKPHISLTARDDDPTPFAAYASVAARRGRILGWIRHSADYRVNEWHIDALDEILELTAMIEETPLLSPRASSRFLAVKEATLILLEVRGRTGSRGSLTGDEVDRLCALTATIPDPHSPCEPLPLPAMSAMDDEHLGWTLSGLFATDGYFGLRNRLGKFAPAASLDQRIDNHEMLLFLRDRFAIGTVAVFSNGKSPLSSWRITRLDECARLASLLRQFPLPLSSPRSAQFDKWTESLAMRRQITDGGRRRGASASDDLEGIYWALRRLKQYAGPRLLCDCSTPTRA